MFVWRNLHHGRIFQVINLGNWCQCLLKAWELLVNYSQGPSKLALPLTCYNDIHPAFVSLIIYLLNQWIDNEYMNYIYWMINWLIEKFDCSMNLFVEQFDWLIVDLIIWWLIAWSIDWYIVQPYNCSSLGDRLVVKCIFNLI